MATCPVESTLVNPARAGMIPYAPHADSHDARKPRASGDDPLPLWATPYESAYFTVYGRDRSVNPARAGMILIRVNWRAATNCKPRASGDDPSRRAITRHSAG